MSDVSDGYVGFRGAVGDDGSEVNALRFLVKSVLSEVATSHVVKVVASRGNGSVAPPGTVDVTILVHQIDGQGNAHPHGTIFNVPYHRQQNGSNGIIMDPQPGDIGVIVCASRDISAVKANRGAASPPGSLRRHDLADALYVGTVIATMAPGQYVQFTDSGIVLHSPGTVTISAPTIKLQGKVEQTGGTVTSNGHSIDNTHQHTAVQTGSQISGPPV
jgi:hypothetical protein